jgi:hypothetical protein
MSFYAGGEVKEDCRHIHKFRDLTHRARLWDRPKPASSAAIRIGVPMPSTTGTPSCF